MGFRKRLESPNWVERARCLFTFRGSVRCRHNDNPVFEQIFKKLFQNHGVGDVSDLRTTTHLFYFNFTSALTNLLMALFFFFQDGSEFQEENSNYRHEE